MTADEDRKTWPVFVGVCLVLPIKALYRVNITASELGSTRAAWLGLGLDALLLCAVILTSWKLAYGEGEHAESGIRTVLTLVALAGGLALIGLRFSGVDGWYSGHLRCCDLRR